MNRLSGFILSVFLFSTAHNLQAVDSSDSLHARLLEKANKSVAEASVKASQDPLRPVYHLTTEANWINDPNGPVFFNSEYHIFFQHNPYGEKWGNMSWGHAVSRDLVHWSHLPIALTPVPGSYDKDGVLSGCCVIGNGVPTIIYTGVNPEAQCIARSYDNMRTWKKFEGNPVIGSRPRNDLEGFRDPFAWKEKDGWYAVIGSGIKGKGGAALLYRSKDLEKWEYIHPLCIGFGENWECPNFFPLGGKHVLLVSPRSDVKYSVGVYKDLRFSPGEWMPVDLGGRSGFYAPNCLADEKGRRIMWGWIIGGGTEGYPWNGAFTLPRVVTLRQDGTLGFEPLPELASLRKSVRNFGEMTVPADSSMVINGAEGDCIEIVAEFEPGNSSLFGINVLCSPDGKEKTGIVIDNQGQKLFSGDKGGNFQLLPGEKTLKLHIFVDKSVVEVYANDRVCMTVRTNPKRKDSIGVQIFSSGGELKVKNFDIWQIGTIWQSKS